MPKTPRLTLTDKPDYEGAVQEALTEQQRRFDLAQEERLGGAKRDYVETATLGALPVPAAVGGGGMPFIEKAKAARDPQWRSDAGRAGAAMREVVDPMRRNLPEKDPSHLATARRRVSGPSWQLDASTNLMGAREPRTLDTEPAVQRAANARAIARETAKKVTPLGVGAVGAGALGATALAAPLVAGPARFVGGEGPGTFAETQDFKSQIDALARYKGGPLDTRDLKQEVFEQLAGDWETAKALIESGSLSEEAIKELGYWQAKDREADEEGELERRRALGMIE